MKYELEKGSRESPECTVRVYTDDMEHVGTYTGRYERKSCAWVLYRKHSFGGYKMPYKLILGEWEVRTKSKPMEMYPNRTEKKEEKPKEAPERRSSAPGGRCRIRRGR